LGLFHFSIFGARCVHHDALEKKKEKKKRMNGKDGVERRRRKKGTAVKRL
jgi:hypothetical protein